MSRLIAKYFKKWHRGKNDEVSVSGV